MNIYKSFIEREAKRIAISEAQADLDPIKQAKDHLNKLKAERREQVIASFTAAALERLPRLPKLPKLPRIKIER